MLLVAAVVPVAVALARKVVIKTMEVEPQTLVVAVVAEQQHTVARAAVALAG